MQGQGTPLSFAMMRIPAKPDTRSGASRSLIPGKPITGVAPVPSRGAETRPEEESPLVGARVEVETILKKRGETIAATAIETYMERGLS